MGTHCAYVARYSDDTTTRFENTMDGYFIVARFQEWIDRGNYGEPMSSSNIGTGHLERNEEGENDQEYWLILDVLNKWFQFSWPMNREIYDSVGKLLSAGWNFLPTSDPKAERLYMILWNPEVSGSQ